MVFVVTRVFVTILRNVGCDVSGTATGRPLEAGSHGASDANANILQRALQDRRTEGLARAKMIAETMHATVGRNGRY